MDAVLEIESLTRGSSAFEGHYKTQSILALANSGIPTPRGLIVREWNDQVRKRVLDFAEANEWGAFLIRHDKRIETPPYPMGGYIVGFEELDSEVSWYIQQGRIVILLEPFNPLDNSYNVSSLFHSNDQVSLEIVGPGFDASDLQRGYLSPHERMDVSLEKIPEGKAPSGRLLRRVTKNRQHIDQRTYSESVRLRLSKIYSRFVLENKRFPDSSIAVSEIAIEEARAMLSHTGHTMLFESETAYVPIDDEHLAEVLGHLSRLPSQCARVFPLKYPFVVAASFVNRGSQLVFWDIVVPALKYRTENSQ